MLASVIALGVAAARALMLAAVVQAAHFVEETSTGLDRRLPAVFGLAAIPSPVFVGFNLAWLAIWAASVPGLRAGRRAALFAAWFLAVAGMGNAVAHPLLALATGGYFPGLVTSPLIGAAGVHLAQRLRAATTGGPSR
jgi:hypothetical protein